MKSLNLDGSGYKGNHLLRKINVSQNWSKEQISEFVKCYEDINYFLEHYIKIVHVDKGIIPFEPRPFQYELAKSINQNRNTIACTARQVGKTTIVAASIIHYILFNKLKTVAILANKAETAREILYKLQQMYEMIPKWMQQGVVEYNKGSFELENGCRVLTSASSGDAIRGYSISLLFLDEAAHLPDLSEFMASIYPTISSGNDTKIVMVSTPNGYNQYHKYWKNANTDRNKKGIGKNGFYPISVTWRSIPERNNARWEAEQREILGDAKFEQEHNISFIGSVQTLISPAKLESLVEQTPVNNPDDDLKFYLSSIEKDSRYILIADVSQGKGQDYHAFSVFDITRQPYVQVATFRNNKITPLEYGEVIYRVATKFNDSEVLIELNDLGIQVAHTLADLEYENLIHVEPRGRKGLQPCYWKSKCDPGLRSNRQTKYIGCQMLKSLIEYDLLVVNDEQTIKELTTFVKSRKPHGSYEAQQGTEFHDDTVIPLVHLGWFVNSDFFKMSSDQDIRLRLRDESNELINQLGSSIVVITSQSERQARSAKVEPTFKHGNDIWKAI